jgi:hypothetical protein
VAAAAAAIARPPLPAGFDEVLERRGQLPGLPPRRRRRTRPATKKDTATDSFVSLATSNDDVDVRRLLFWAALHLSYKAKERKREGVGI